MGKVNNDSMKEMYLSLYSTFVKKNNDYGNSFEESLDSFGLTAGIVRIGDKWNRLRTLSQGTISEVESESLSDTLEDMANYCAMTAVWFKRNGVEVSKNPIDFIEAYNTLFSNWGNPPMYWRYGNKFYVLIPGFKIDDKLTVVRLGYYGKNGFSIDNPIHFEFIKSLLVEDMYTFDTGLDLENFFNTIMNNHEMSFDPEDYGWLKRYPGINPHARTIDYTGFIGIIEPFMNRVGFVKCVELAADNDNYYAHIQVPIFNNWNDKLPCLFHSADNIIIPIYYAYDVLRDNSGCVLCVKKYSDDEIVRGAIKDILEKIDPSSHKLPFLWKYVNDATSTKNLLRKSSIFFDDGTSVDIYLDDLKIFGDTPKQFTNNTLLESDFPGWELNLTGIPPIYWVNKETDNVFVFIPGLTYQGRRAIFQTKDCRKLRDIIPYSKNFRNMVKSNTLFAKKGYSFKVYTFDNNKDLVKFVDIVVKGDTETRHDEILYYETHQGPRKVRYDAFLRVICQFRDTIGMVKGEEIAAVLCGGDYEIFISCLVPDTVNELHMFYKAIYADKQEILIPYFQDYLVDRDSKGRVIGISCEKEQENIHKQDDLRESVVELYDYYKEIRNKFKSLESLVNMNATENENHMASQSENNGFVGGYSPNFVKNLRENQEKM